jgi:HAD superfamily phosphatase
MKLSERKVIGPLDILIFDMDGVLIDVSRSYRETIRKTVQIYFETCLGLKKGNKPLITQDDISLFKSMGGFNNDWDLTSGLLFYLLSISGMPPLPRQKKFSTLAATLQRLRVISSQPGLTPFRIFRNKNTKAFVKSVSSYGAGLAGVGRTLRETHGDSWNGWVYRSGNLNEGNVVQRIFQEVYLGDQFVRHYRLQRIFYKGPGYYLRERLLIPRKILASLHRRLRMGIASGRPRLEAELALKRFGLNRYFDSVVTLDECEAEELRILRSTGRHVKRSKPHPYSLLRGAREIGIPKPRCAYIGDVVDDIRAARSASNYVEMHSIGFLTASKNWRVNAQLLLKAGAALAVEHPVELLRLFP